MEYGNVLIIDGRSFSSKPLHYELVEHFASIHPDICIGTDKNFTSKELENVTKAYFEDAGLKVMVNIPFFNMIIPESFYSRHAASIIP